VAGDVDAVDDELVVRLQVLGTDQRLLVDGHNPFLAGWIAAKYERCWTSAGRPEMDFIAVAIGVPRETSCREQNSANAAKGEAVSNPRSSCATVDYKRATSAFNSKQNGMVDSRDQRWNTGTPPVHLQNDGYCAVSIRPKNNGSAKLDEAIRYRLWGPNIGHVSKMSGIGEIELTILCQDIKSNETHARRPRMSADTTWPSAARRRPPCTQSRPRMRRVCSSGSPSLTKSALSQAPPCELM